MRCQTSDELLAMTDQTFMEDVDKFVLVKVKCFDGEVITTNRHIQYLHGFLHFNRKFNTPVYKAQVFGQDYIPSPNDHAKSMELAVDVVYNHLSGVTAKHAIAPMWSQCLDAHTNACIADIEHFMARIDARDIMDINYQPEVVALRTEMKDILAGSNETDVKGNVIADCNSEYIKFIKDHQDDLFYYNGVSQHITASSIKIDQYCQVANVVGYVAEINSEIYPVPTAESFAEGMCYMYTYATNVSLGKKATLYNKTPISLTETLNRLIQHMTSQIEEVEVCDCGSKRTTPTLIPVKNWKAYIGMYHVLANGTVQLLTHDIVKRLAGKFVDLRTVAGCNIEDPRRICSTCGGHQTLNMVDNYNIGGSASSLVMGRNSQKILKTKHVEIIDVSEGNHLAPILRDYLFVSDNGRDIFLKDNVPNPKIMFNATRRKKDDKSRNGEFLQTIFSLKSISEADLSTFGEVSTIGFDPNNALDEPIDDTRIKAGTTANFTREILEFIRANPDALTMTVGPKKRLFYKLDLTTFDETKPILTLPFMHYDSLTLHNELNTFFVSPNDKEVGTVLTDYNTFGKALRHLVDMTYGHLSVPAGTLQMLLLPFTIRDKSKGDWRMTNKGDDCTFGKLEQVRNKRSLSVVTVASKQYYVYSRIGPLVGDKMTPHTYDAHFI